VSILLDNKILAAAEAKVEAGLAPDNRDDYMKIVVAGMRAGLAKAEAGILASLKNSRDPVADAAVGAINLVMLLRQQSRGTMPPKAIPPAAMTLMLKALDFVDRARIKKIGARDLDRATRIFANHMFNIWKITPAVLNSMAVKTHGLMKDPTAMELLARRAGVVKDPRVSTPTGLPLATQKGARNVAS
jgi:hypothetical protein